MAHELITSGVNFKLDDISFSDPIVDKRGGKKIKILDSKGRNLCMSTPLMLTWGVNESDYENTGNPKYDMSLQFPSEQYANASVSAFFENMKGLEDKILDTASGSKSKEWLNKGKMSREVASALFNPMLRYPKDKETGEPDMTRMPTLRAKINNWDGKFNVELYDTTPAPNAKLLFSPDRGDCREGCDGTPMDIIPKASHVACILQCGGIWFIGGKFGISWSLVQAVVRPPVRISGSCYLTLGDDDQSTMDSLKEREDTAAAEEEEQEEAAEEGGADSVFVADSDEEEEEVVAPPKPAPKKKRVVKRKKTTTAAAE